MLWIQIIVFAVVVIGMFVLGVIVGAWIHNLVNGLSPLDSIRHAWDRFLTWLTNRSTNPTRGTGDPGSASGGVAGNDPAAPFGRAADGYVYTSHYDCHNGRDADGFTCVAVDSPVLA